MTGKELGQCWQVEESYSDAVISSQTRLAELRQKAHESHLRERELTAEVCSLLARLPLLTIARLPQLLLTLANDTHMYILTYLRADVNRHTHTRHTGLDSI